MTGGDALAEALQAGDVDVVFGLPGVQLDAAFDALARRLDRFRVYHTRHEQAASYMAEGYARVTGRAACCLVVPGPGLLNATAGLATAYACNTPVICVAGDVRTDAVDAGLGQLHEIPHQLELLGSVTKWAGRATRVEEVAPLVTEALARMRRGRARPVGVTIPFDLLEATLDEAGFRSPGPPAATEANGLEGMDRAVDLLRRADRPLIVAGGGVLQSGAWAELREVAERLRAPVVVTINGKGAISSDHPLACEPLTIKRLLPAADVVLAVGTRLARRGGDRWRLDGGQSLIRIDADPEEASRPPATVMLEVGARRGLSLLSELVERRDGTGWRELDRVRREAEERVQSLQPQAAYGSAIRRVLPDDAVLLSGLTQLGYWSGIGYPVRRPRTFLTAGYQGTLGYEVPTALGAQLGVGERRVVALVGDGGFLYNVGELASAVLHRIPAVLVVFDDGAYGNVARIQRNRFGRQIASRLDNPDFLRLAAAFGVTGLRAESPDELEAALGRALSTDGPVLIHAPVGEMADPWPLIMGR
jgi:acetolactate synthase-1/2/3 large subunit